MHPVLFQLHTPFGNHPIYAYGLMLGLAVLAGWYVMHLAARRLRIDERVVENAYAFGALAALVGGRLAYVAANRAAFPTLLDALMPMHGGLLGPGAFAAGALAAHLVARRAGVSSLLHVRVRLRHTPRFERAEVAHSDGYVSAVQRSA